MALDGDAMLAGLGIDETFHLQRSECCERASAWLASIDGFGGLAAPEQARAWNFGDLGSAMYPNVPVEYAVLGAHLTNWIAVVDDTVERDPDAIGELRGALIGSSRPSEARAGLVAGWNEIFAFLTEDTTPRFRDRLRAACMDLFDAYAWEVQYRESGRIPSLAEFTRFRPDTAGMGIYLLVLERGVDGPLADEVVDAPWFRDINGMVGNLACWANDILSFQWDRSIRNPINLVRVLEEGVDETNTDRAWAHFLDTWARMRSLRGTWMPRVSGPARDYLEQLPEVASGVIVWMRLTRRYSMSPSA